MARVAILYYYDATSLQRELKAYMYLHSSHVGIKGRLRTRSKKEPWAAAMRGASSSSYLRRRRRRVCLSLSVSKSSKSNSDSLKYTSQENVREWALPLTAQTVARRGTRKRRRGAYVREYVRCTVVPPYFTLVVVESV